jgi:transcription elongation factor Elf1
MIEICSHCGADNLIDDAGEHDATPTCHNCGGKFEVIPAGDWGFVDDEWSAEFRRRKQLSQDYHSLDDGEDDPDLEDADIED